MHRCIRLATVLAAFGLATAALGQGRLVDVVEFYHPTLDHYFISASVPEIQALDAGRFPGWARTGVGFAAYDGPIAGASPVCRFYLPPPFGDSHFFSASPAECSDVRARFPMFSYEAPNVFYVPLPDTTSGACPPGTLPVYRLFDNRADTNHRYSTSLSIRHQMMMRGYIAEGYGPDGVAMCAPPAAVAAPDTIQLAWVLAPTRLPVPGLTMDPDPSSIQDGGLNSSVVLGLTRDGRPVAGEAIVWATSDPTGQVQFLTALSDADGLVRAWYHVGVDPQQTLTAQHAASGKSSSLTLDRVDAPAPTVGRYVSTHYFAPAGTYTATSIGVVPKTSPLRTYYALTTLWKTDGQIGLYGGLQMYDCSEPSPNPGMVAACSPTRGAYRGRLALFSSWDLITTGGQHLPPILVNAPAPSHCLPLTTEGDFLHCAAPLDWAVDELWQWTVEILAGAPAGYQRVRVTASSAARRVKQEIATVDVAGTLQMDHLSAFDENWDGARAPTCLDVELRKMSVLNMGFWNGRQWVKPDAGVAQGGQYSETTTRCQNYAVTVGSAGVDIASGGRNLWVRLSDSLVYDPATGRRTFPTNEQVNSQWQNFDPSTVGLPP